MPGSDLYEHFLGLHTRDGGLVMPNVWDGLSARIFADAGFEAIGTSSFALAAMLGRLDGRHAVTKDEHLDHASLLARLTGLPVNGDFEDGYGETAGDVATTVDMAVVARLAGIGIEDTSGDPDHPIRDFDEAVDRVRHAVRAAKQRLVVTGRTDNFIAGRPDLDDTVRRLSAFAEVGADVLYAPLLPDLAAVSTVVDAVAPKPVNVLISPTDRILTVTELQQARVKRISLGSALYKNAMGTVAQAAEALRAGDLATASAGMPTAEVTRLLGGTAP